RGSWSAPNRCTTIDEASTNAGVAKDEAVKEIDTIGGSALIEVRELTVMATGVSFVLVVTTATPAGCSRNAALNSSGDIESFSCSSVIFTCSTSIFVVVIYISSPLRPSAH